VFEQLFEEIVARCLEAGLVQGDNLSVDSSFVKANANKGSRIPREQLAEAARVKQTVRQYLVELEQQNPTEEPVHQQEQAGVHHRSRCDYATKGVRQLQPRCYASDESRMLAGQLQTRPRISAGLEQFARITI
jgi:hypothetical protein